MFRTSHCVSVTPTPSFCPLHPLSHSCPIFSSSTFLSSFSPPNPSPPLFLYIPLSLSIPLSLLFSPQRQSQSSSQSPPHSTNSAVTSADMKFLLIPLAFLLLRSGSIVVVIMFVYAQAHAATWVAYLLLYIAVSETGEMESGAMI